MSEDLPKMIKVFFPTCAVDHNVVDISSCEVLATTEYVIDHPLKSCWSAVEPKRHDIKETQKG